MKILYGMPGMGNGHISRALELIPKLQQEAQVDILLTGNDYNVNLPFDIKYRKKGLGFHLGTEGKIDLIRSVNKLHLVTLVKDILEIPVEEYDVVVSDFEAITAWACEYKMKNCIHVGNIASYLSRKIPRIQSVDLIAELAVKFYAPTSHKIGFHYECYDDFILTPLIRQQIRNASITQDNHYTVYLLTYHDKFLTEILKKMKHINWEVFSRYAKKESGEENVRIIPIDSEKFIQSLSSCKGLITSGGFQATSEALFLGKKILVIPINNHYEQECNAEALRRMGVMSLDKVTMDFPKEITKWEKDFIPIKKDYEDVSDKVVEKILQMAK